MYVCINYEIILCNSTLSLPVLLQDIIVQVIEYHRADPSSDYGHVFLFVCSSNAHEHAARVQNNHNPGFRGSPVQLTIDGLTLYSWLAR